MNQTITIQVQLVGGQAVSAGLQGVATNAKSAASSLTFLSNALKAAVFGKIAREVTDLGDEYLRLKNKVAVFATSQEQANQNLTDVIDVAVRSRASLEEIGTLYQRLQVALQGTGTSSKEVARLTETLAKSFALSGASVQEQQGAIRQLTQAISFGALRGQELNSVLKEAPVLAQAIAEEMGVATSDLKKLGAEGKITSDVVISAVQHMHDAVEEKFGKTAPTFSQAFVQLKDVAVEAFAKLDEDTGIISGLTRALSDLALIIHDILNEKDSISGVVGVSDELIAGWREFKALIEETWITLKATVEIGYNLVTLDFAGASEAIDRNAASMTKLHNARDALNAARDQIANSAGGAPAQLLAGGTPEEQAASAAQFADWKKRNEIAQQAAREFAYQSGDPSQSAADVHLARAGFAAKKNALGPDAESSPTKKPAAELDTASRAAQKALKDFEKLNGSYSQMVALQDDAANAQRVLREALARGVITQAQAADAADKYTEHLRLQRILIHEDLDPAYKTIRDNLEGLAEEYDPARAAAKKFSDQQYALNDAIEAGVPNAVALKADILPKITLEMKLAGLETDKATQALKDFNHAVDDVVGGFDPLVDENNKYAATLEKIAKLRNEAAARGDQSAVDQLDAAGRKAEQAHGGSLIDAKVKKTGTGDLGGDLANSFDASLKGMVESLGTQGELLKQGFDDIFQHGADALKTLLEGGKVDFRELALSALRELTLIQLKLLALKALEAANSYVQGGGLGGPGGFVGTILGGASNIAKAAAGGGDVTGGFRYIVGEHGPETFVAPMNGKILPNGAGGGGTTVHMTVVTPDANSFRQSQSQIQAEMGAKLARAQRRNG